MSISLLIDNAINAKVLSGKPDQTILTGITNTNDPVIRSLHELLASSTEYYKKIQKKNPNFFTFSEPTIKIKDLIGKPAIEWVKQIHSRVSATKAIVEDGYSLSVQKGDYELYLVLEDGKGRQHQLFTLAIDSVKKENTFVFENETLTLLPNLAKVINSNGSLHPIGLSDIILVSPVSNERYTQQANTIASLIPTRPLSESDSNIKGLHNKTLIPYGIHGSTVNAFMATLFKLDKDDLKKDYRYGPTSKTVKRVLMEILAKPEHRETKHFIEAITVALTEKGMIVAPDRKYNLLMISPNELEKQHKNGLSDHFVSQILAIADFDRKSDVSNDFDVDEYNRKKAQRLEEREAAKKKKLEQENAKQSNTTPQKKGPSSPVQDLPITESVNDIKTVAIPSESMSRLSTSDSPKVTEAKQVFSRIYQSVEASQLSKTLINILNNGQNAVLMPPETSAIEHMVIAMQYQPDNIDDGLRWIANTINAAALRNAPRTLASGYSTSTPKPHAPGYVRKRD